MAYLLQMRSPIANMICVASDLNRQKSSLKYPVQIFQGVKSGV
jgi:hypothetical protein